MTAFRRQLSDFTSIPEPRLQFGGNGRGAHPLVGLQKHGPFDAQSFGRSSIRLAYVAPKNCMGLLKSFAANLNQTVAPKELDDHYPVYPGFNGVFRVPIELDNPANTAELPERVNELANTGEALLLAQEVTRCLSQLKMRGGEFDVVMVLFPRAWENCSSDDGFDFHDFVKSYAAMNQIPVQFIRQTTIETRDTANVMWGLSIALYAKTGGVPWILSTMETNEVYVGISYAIKAGSDGTEFLTCCSQVFSSRGLGFEFVAYDTRDFEYVNWDRRNPHLRYHEMQSVLSRSLNIYQDRTGGQIPDKVTVHKNSPFTEEEGLGAIDSFRSGTDVELVQIVMRPKWKGMFFKKSDSKMCPDGFPVRRGTYLPLTGREALLWTQGGVLDVHLTNSRYVAFKEGGLKEIPYPILVRRYAGNGGWHETCEGIMGLTKMDWNSNTVYTTSPVTLEYAHTFASVLKQNQGLVNDEYNFRFFM